MSPVVESSGQLTESRPAGTQAEPGRDSTRISADSEASRSIPPELEAPLMSPVGAVVKAQATLGTARRPREDEPADHAFELEAAPSGNSSASIDLDELLQQAATVSSDSSLEQLWSHSGERSPVNPAALGRGVRSQSGSNPLISLVDAHRASPRSSMPVPGPLPGITPSPGGTLSGPATPAAVASPAAPGTRSSPHFELPQLALSAPPPPMGFGSNLLTGGTSAGFVLQPMPWPPPPYVGSPPFAPLAAPPQPPPATQRSPAVVRLASSAATPPESAAVSPNGAAERTSTQPESQAAPSSADVSAADDKPAAEPRVIATSCLACGRAVKARDKLAGQRVKCPKCGQPVKIPNLTTAAESDSDASPPVGAISLSDYITAALNTPAPPVPEERQFTSVLRAATLKKLTSRIAAGRAADAPRKVVEAASDAIEELCQSRDARAVETLAAEFPELPLGLRAQALKQLAALGDPAAVPLTLPLLESPDEPILRGAVMCLGALGDRRAVQPLLALALIQPEHRIRAIDAVWRLGEAALPSVLELLDSDIDSGLKHAALEVLGRLKHPKSISAAARCLEHPSLMIRRTAAEVLGQFDDLRATTALAVVLVDPDEHLRLTAARGIARTPEPRLAPRLVPLLKEQSRDLRLAGLQALGACGDKNSLSLLRPFLQDPDDEFAVSAGEALGRLGDSESVDQLIIRLESVGSDSEQQPLTLRLIDALRRIGDGRAALPLVNVLTHPSPRVRARVAESLGRFRDPGLRPALEDLLRGDPMDEVRAASARALGDLGQSEVTTILLNVGLSDVPAVRVQSLIALSQYPRELQVEMVSHLVTDPVPQMRYQVASLLGEIGDPAATPILTPLAFDSEDMVRRAARRALQELGDTRTEKELKKAVGKRPATPARSSAMMSTVAPRPKKRRRFSALDLVPTPVFSLLGLPGRLLPPMPRVSLEQLETIPGGKGALIAAGLVVASIGYFFTQTSGGMVTHSSVPPRGNVASLAAAGDGRFIVAGRTKRMIEIWNPQDQQLLERIVDTPSQWVACSADGTALLAADATQVRRLKLNAGGVVESTEDLTGHSASIQLFAGSDNGRFAATVDTDGRLIRWSLESGPATHVELPGPGGDVRRTALAISPNGEQAAVAYSDGRISLWECASKTLVGESTAVKLSITALAFSPDGTQLAAAAGNQNSNLCIWRTGVLPERPIALTTKFFRTDRLCFRQDGKLIATSGVQAEVWDLTAREATGMIAGVTIDALTLLNGDRLAVGDDEDRPILIYGGDGKVAQTLDEPPKG